LFIAPAPDRLDDRLELRQLARQRRIGGAARRAGAELGADLLVAAQNDVEILGGGHGSSNEGSAECGGRR
jgi:hypothetical protein